MHADREIACVSASAGMGLKWLSHMACFWYVGFTSWTKLTPCSCFVAHIPSCLQAGSELDTPPERYENIALQEFHRYNRLQT